MRRLITLGSMLMMLFLLAVSCGDDKNEDVFYKPIIGKWYYSEIYVNGEFYSFEENDEDDNYIEFRKNGTAKVYTNSEGESETLILDYEIKGKTLILDDGDEEQTATFNISGKRLTLFYKGDADFDGKIDDVKHIFKRK